VNRSSHSHHDDLLVFFARAGRCDWRAIEDMDRPDVGGPLAASVEVNVLCNYPDPHALLDGTTWTAELESFDQRHDDAFYAVTLTRDGVMMGCIMAVVHAGGTKEQIEKRVAAVAQSGRSNTDYAGNHAWRAGREAAGDPVPGGSVGVVTWKGSPPD
jgi:hypothetical protein